MENSNFSTWITSLYVFQPSSVVFACKTAHFRPKFQVSMGPSPQLQFLHAKQRVLAPNYKSLWVPDLTCPCVQSKRRDLHQNIKSILVPALICGFVFAKQRLYNQNYMTLWVPDLASGFVNAKQRSSTRMTTLYGFQPFTCGLGCKTAWFAPEWQDYIATSHHLWFCACKTAPLGLELQVSVGQRPHLCFFHAKQWLYDQTYKSVGVPALTCGFVHAKQRL